MEILIATSKHIEAITGFQMDMALESEGTKLDRERVKQGVSAVIDDSNKGLYLVAEHSGRAIGSLMITREWSDWNNAWYWWIQSVFVLPEFRGQGTFRAMLTKVKEMASEQQVSEIRLYVDKDNKPAQEVYAKLGLKECNYQMLSINLLYL